MKPPAIYQTIKQPPESYACAACVAAMAVGRSLGYATARMAAALTRDGRAFYRTREVLSFLGSHGIHPGLVVWSPVAEPISKRARLRMTFDVESGPAVLSVAQTTYRDVCHMVFWDGEHVRDPNPNKPETTPLSAYRVRELWPLVYIDDHDDEEPRDVQKVQVPR